MYNYKSSFLNHTIIILTYVSLLLKFKINTKINTFFLQENNLIFLTVDAILFKKNVILSYNNYFL